MEIDKSAFAAQGVRFRNLGGARDETIEGEHHFIRSKWFLEHEGRILDRSGERISGILGYVNVIGHIASSI